MVFDQWMRRNLIGQEFMKACTFCVVVTVVLHVTYALLLKIINFVLSLREYELQIFLSFINGSFLPQFYFDI